jgi:AcrR family transcriptional regulator
MNGQDDGGAACSGKATETEGPRLRLVVPAAGAGEETGGEPACYAYLVCEECGAVTTEGHADGCPLALRFAARPARSYDGGMNEGRQAQRRSYPKGVRRRQQILDSVIAVLAQRGTDRASLRTIGEAIGISHAALRHYFSSRDELLLAAYRAHEAHADADAPPADGSPVSPISAAAERNRAIPGLVELYATLTTDALQEQHALTRDFIRDRFSSLRAEIAARIAAGQRAGLVPGDIEPLDAAALVIAASDGLQIQWLLEPDEVDVGRSLAILERLFPRDPDSGAEG